MLNYYTFASLFNAIAAVVLGASHPTGWWLALPAANAVLAVLCGIRAVRH